MDRTSSAANARLNTTPRIKPIAQWSPTLMSPITAQATRPTQAVTTSTATATAYMTR